MAGDQMREITSPKGRVVQDFLLRIKLVLRLMADRRVSTLVKVIPLAAILYLLGFPDLAPGPVDDAGVIWLGMYLFVELCPPDVVDEHMAILKRTSPNSWQDQVSSSDEIIEADFWEET
jgi:hypothetical protein